MYLTRLYKQHKGWFLFVLIFIAGQLVINYKRGVVCSPFLHYGMYSAIMKPQSSYETVEVTVNGKLLQTKNFSPQQWDNIMQPLLLFKTQDEWNTNMWLTDIHRLTHFNNKEKYVNHLSEPEFKKWYKSYLQSKLNQPIDYLQITFTKTPV